VIDIMVLVNVLGIGALVFMVITTIYTLFYESKVKKKNTIENERIINALSIEESVRKSALLESAMERIPVGLSQEQFRTLIDEITSRPLSFIESSNSTIGAFEKLVNNYHEQALDQARSQFWISIIAATIGFGWILWAGISIEPANIATNSKILPGVVMDAIAYLFFKQASETRQRATELYDRLRRDKQMAVSESIVGSIEDVRLRSAVKAQLALHMAGLQLSPIDFTSFLSEEPK